MCAGRLIFCAAIVVPSMAFGQGTTVCTYGSAQSSGAALPGGRTVEYLGGHVVVHCPDRGITLTSDSAEYYSDPASGERIYTIGRVHYDEPRLSMVSDFLTYFATQDRVLATGHVNAKLPTGSTLIGPQAEYLREMPTRPLDRWFRSLMA